MGEKELDVENGVVKEKNGMLEENKMEKLQMKIKSLSRKTMVVKKLIMKTREEKGQNQLQGKEKKIC